MRFGYMKLKEKDVVETLDNIYCGILINYPNFKDGDIKTLVYDLSCPEYKELIYRYHMTKLRQTCHFFVKSLAHSLVY